MRTLWSFSLASCLALMLTISLAVLAGNPLASTRDASRHGSPRQNGTQQSSAPQMPAPQAVPTVNGAAGDCTADFTVKDAAGKGIYDAKIRIQIKYGFLGAHRIDAVVGTNSDGKARFIGLPRQIRGSADFTISHGDQMNIAAYDPLSDCNAKHDVTLGAK